MRSRQRTASGQSPFPVPAGIPVAWPFCSNVSPSGDCKGLWVQTVGRPLWGLSCHREGLADHGEVADSDT